MKCLLSVVILNLGFFCCSQNLSESNVRLASLCKVWGFLKYHHPAINEGKIDFDKELFRKIDEISTLKSQQELHQLYANWVKELNKYCKKESYPKRSSLLPSQERLFQKWQSEVDIYGDIFISEVKEMMLLERKRKSLNYAFQNPLDAVGSYISKNEKPYNTFQIPNPNIQLLSLFRYWNIIEYFYPHKPTNWDKILEKNIPVFNLLSSKVEYHLALSSLTAEIEDGHVSLKTNTSDLYDYSYVYQLPFHSKTFQTHTVITNIPKEFQSNLNVGDTIIAIDNIPINVKLDSIKKYFQASNESSFLARVHTKLFSGSKNILNLTIVRNRDTLKISEKRYTYDEISGSLQKGFLSLHNPPKEINQSILYIDPSYYNQKTFSKKLKQSKNYKFIILDMRGYPLIRHNVFTDFIASDERHFATQIKPDITTPGVFINRKDYTGKKNKNPYHGKVILLVNEWTQSASEYSCMAMQSFDNVITIGSTTAGADGNISKVYLPGNVETIFTGLGILYPDGTPAQHLGVKIDIQVDNTAEAIIKNQDLILQKAINYAMDLIEKEN